MPKNTREELTSEISAKSVRPVIQDVVFKRVSTVLLNGVAYRVRHREDDVIAELVTTDAWNDEEAGSRKAIQMVREDGENVVEVTFSLLNLRELTWDEKQATFVDLAGTTYEFLCLALRGKV